MTVGKKDSKRNLPSSGDRLIDALFKVLIDTLEKEIEAIRLKKVLFDPSGGPLKRKKELYGIIIEGRIFLGKRIHKKEKESIVLTLVHEVFHAALPFLKERRIYQLGAIVYTRLTDAQKRFLRKYIPKHEVKEEPSIEPAS